MGYTVEPREGRRGHQSHLVDALLQYLDHGDWERYPEIDEAIKRHSSPLERQTRSGWGEATNLVAMATVLRATDFDQAEGVATLMYMDQADHGQPGQYQLCHRGQIEDMSIEYADEQALAAWAAMLASRRGNVDPELGEAARQHRRRDLVLYALHSTQAGRVHIACGRVYGNEPSRNLGLEWELAAALRRGNGPDKPSNERNLYRLRRYYLAQVAREEKAAVMNLFEEEERRALLQWIRSRYVSPEFLRLLQDIRLDEPLRLLAWTDGGTTHHVSWWETMHTYRQGQPLVISQGEKMYGALSRGAKAKVEQWRNPEHGTRGWAVEPARMPSAHSVVVPESAVEIAFHRDRPPEVKVPGLSVQPTPPPSEPEERIDDLVDGAERHIIAYRRTRASDHLQHAANKLLLAEAIGR